MVEVTAVVFYDRGHTYTSWPLPGEGDERVANFQVFKDDLLRVPTGLRLMQLRLAIRGVTVFQRKQKGDVYEDVYDEVALRSA